MTNLEMKIDRPHPENLWMVRHGFRWDHCHRIVHGETTARTRNHRGHYVSKGACQRNWILSCPFAQVGTGLVFGAGDGGMHIAGMFADTSHLL